VAVNKGMHKITHFVQSIFPPQKQQLFSPNCKNSPLQAGELETWL